MRNIEIRSTETNGKLPSTDKHDEKVVLYNDCIFTVAEKRSTLRRQAFIKTSQYFKCRSFLDSHNIILITGDAGSGKTSIAKKLFKERKGRTSGDCFQIQSPEELGLIGSSAKVVLFDDVFGDYAEDISMTSAWYSQIGKIHQMSSGSRKIVFILTSAEDIYFRCKDRKNLNFLQDYIVRLSSIALGKDDCENVMKEIRCPFDSSSSDLGLFQICGVWTFFENQQIPVDRTFKMSRASIDKFLEKVLQKEKDVFFAILIILVFGNNLSKKDVNLQSPKIKRIAKLIGYNIDKGIVMRALQKFELIEENTYSISSFVIFDVACTFSIKHYPEVFIENCELDVLDKLSKYFETIDEEHVEKLCRRLSSDLDRLIGHKLYNPLKNGRTLRIFLEILSNCEEKKDKFLNSHFLWFTCWSGNDMITESLLRRMTGRNPVIKRAIEGCSSEVILTALKKCLGAEADDSPQSPNIYEAMQEDPFSAVLNFDAVECQLKEFPRLRYHSKLIKGLGDRFTKLQSEVPGLNILHFENWSQTRDNPTIYLAGETASREQAYMQLAFMSGKTRSQRKIAKTDQQKAKSEKSFSDFRERSPSCILWCCDERESKSATISSIKQLSKDVANSELTILGRCVIIVLNHGEGFSLSKKDFTDNPKDCIQIIISTNDRSDLLEYLTSAFEIPMIEYIRLLQSTIDVKVETASAKRLNLLKTETNALLQRLHQCSKLLEETAKPSAPMKVPEKVLAELDRNADKIYGYGFRPDEFYVLIDDRLSPKEKKALEKKIQKQLSKSKEFEMKVKFENSKGVSFTKHLGSGSCVLPDLSKPNSYGTLGGFAQINSKDVVGLTSYHVIRQDVEAYVKNGDTTIKLGKCTLVLVPGPESLADFALINVDEQLKDECKKPLVDDENEPKSATVYCGELDRICPAIVHKNGASTGMTQGTIVQSLTYREMLGDQQTRSVLMVEDLEEEKFGEPGDSGSLVFQNSLSASQSSIEVLAILTGRYKGQGVKEESRYIMCSDMKYICENLEERGKRLQFFEKDDSTGN